ncbi:hypothetical protein BZA70DRAFT_290149 [Myxozyma melibiosi]|uniref:MARVEL domain-containing protein n=1 Tax=Myxozyma melibiosi TaxID=54550 RepID=A0ABR1F4S0_9ASCO
MARRRRVQPLYINYGVRDRGPEPPNTLWTSIRIFFANLSNCCTGRTNPDNKQNILGGIVSALVHLCGFLCSVLLMTIYALNLQAAARAPSRHSSHPPRRERFGVMLAAISIMFAALKMSPAISWKIRNFFPLSIFLGLSFLVFALVGSGNSRFFKQPGDLLSDSQVREFKSFGEKYARLVSGLLAVYWLFATALTMVEIAKRDRLNSQPLPTRTSDLNNLPPEILQRVSPVSMPTESHPSPASYRPAANNFVYHTLDPRISAARRAYSRAHSRQDSHRSTHSRKPTSMAHHAPPTIAPDLLSSQRIVTRSADRTQLPPPAYSPVDPLSPLSQSENPSDRYSLRKRSPPPPKDET